MQFYPYPKPASGPSNSNICPPWATDWLFLLDLGLRTEQSHIAVGAEPKSFCYQLLAVSPGWAGSRSSPGGRKAVVLLLRQVLHNSMRKKSSFCVISQARGSPMSSQAICQVLSLGILFCLWPHLRCCLKAKPCSPSCGTKPPPATPHCTASLLLQKAFSNSVT